MIANQNKLSANRNASKANENLSKDEWRTLMRQASASWRQKPAAECASVHAKLEENLRQVLQSATGIWGGYSALVDEPALSVDDPAHGIGRLGALRFAFPAIEAENRLRYLIPKTKYSFLEGSWGVAEPDPRDSTEVATDEISGVLIPALAFDRHGIRLGRGKGYYDRWLSDFRGTKVGVAYSWQIAAGDLPREAFDIPMDIVVTDQEIIRCRDIEET